MDMNIKVKKTTNDEEDRDEKFFGLMKQSPIPDNEFLNNIGLYINRKTLSKILFMDMLYKKIINVTGNIIEFGCRWGYNLVLYENLHGIYEPYNHNRKIIGFDTFTGFPSYTDNDKNAEKGVMKTTKNYELYLDNVLNYHEKCSPISHIRKYEIIKGDVCKTFPTYLKKHPELIVSLVYFDMDLYEPTKTCLKNLYFNSCLHKGSILAFGQICYSDYPGETIALKEIFGMELDNFHMMRTPFDSVISYMIME